MPMLRRWSGMPIESRTGPLDSDTLDHLGDARAIDQQPPAMDCERIGRDELRAQGALCPLPTVRGFEQRVVTFVEIALRTKATDSQRHIRLWQMIFQLQSILRFR